jgi:hypothetical protein
MRRTFFTPSQYQQENIFLVQYDLGNESRIEDVFGNARIVSEGMNDNL